jgi:hypothetical protein
VSDEKNSATADGDALPGDSLDDMVDDSPENAREWFRRKAQTEGLRVAFETALDVMKDKKAPAPARATAAGLIMRGAGVFSRKFEEESEADTTDLASMSPEALQRALKRAEAQSRELSRQFFSPTTTKTGRGRKGGGRGNDDGGVFG